MNKYTNSWKPFRLEGNIWFGEVTTPETWRAVVGEYYLGGAGDIEVLKTAGYLNGSIEEYGIPAFGFYGEYQGELTLGEWAENNSIDLMAAAMEQ